MTQLSKEEADLHKAELDIADAEHRVGNQALRVERLRQDGHDISDAERLLASMRRMTELLHDHRELILEQIVRPPEKAATHG